MTEAIHKKRNGLSPWSVHLLDLIQSARCKIIVALAEIGYENGHAGCGWRGNRRGAGSACPAPKEGPRPPCKTGASRDGPTSSHRKSP